jgi:hypothetical protein
MKLEFESIEEVKEFVTKLKGTRGGAKGGTDDEPQPSGQAPAPLAPPTGGPATGFPGPGGFAGPAGGAFPAAAATGPAPEVVALVQRISARIDVSIKPPPDGLGQPAENVLSWFRQQCGAETANYTMDQIKQSALPRLTVAQLDGIAKLIAA